MEEVEIKRDKILWTNHAATTNLSQKLISELSWLYTKDTKTKAIHDSGEIQNKLLGKYSTCRLIYLYKSIRSQRLAHGVIQKTGTKWYLKKVSE